MRFFIIRRNTNRSYFTFTIIYNACITLSLPKSKYFYELSAYFAVVFKVAVDAYQWNWQSMLQWLKLISQSPQKPLTSHRTALSVTTSSAYVTTICLRSSRPTNPSTSHQTQVSADTRTHFSLTECTMYGIVCLRVWRLVLVYVPLNGVLELLILKNF